MTKSLVFLVGVGAGVLTTYCLPRITPAAVAQPLSQTQLPPARSGRKTLIDNDRVQVIDYTLQPGDRAPGMHTHSYPHVDVILAGGSVMVNNADGTTTHLTAQTDSVYYRSAPVTHEPINTGDKPIHLIEVHIK